MGKETQLLEAASAGNNSKVEQLLKGQSKLQKLLSSDKLSDGLSDSPPPLVIQNKKQSSSINVDYRDDTGSTALMLAVLHGHKDVVYTLLQYSAELFTMDNQGNTALHFAAWHNRSDIVDLLLANGALAEIANREGNTPLHYTCQYCPPGKTFTINKLLQHNCNVLVTNMAGDSPFDLAVRFNKIDAVPLLIDADVRTLKQTKPIIEAAKSGRKEIIEILLEAGMDPNIFDHNKGTFPMHEAIRYFKKNVAQLLLEFGGDPTQQVSNGQTAISIAKQHPEAKRDEFISMFVQQRGKPLRVPKSQQTHDSPKEKVSADLFITYPLLKNKAEWCQPTPDYCSAWTKQHPPTCLLDNDPISYWKIPAAGAYNWVAVDLGSEYTLTGVRIA
ncbi:ankyrin repeat and sterile alpha motif domain-containing protein 1B-like isoform X1 [Halichondria panicea]|uniref:ankyrin repeat and sterile alpha motif domain-containing protein 1B-like isoform X1 n=1 Tax=Halichondria panicea TaxID=6063 RepID=UPI00312BAA8B